MASVRLLEMTTDEVARKAEDGALAILPVASTEVLGHHGPLGADVFVADEVATRVAALVGAVVAPTMPVGDAADMMPWAGTLTIRPSVLTEVYVDICDSLASHGFRRVLFLTAHLGNMAAVAACAKLVHSRGILVAQVDWWRAAARVSADLLESSEYPTGHGSELISSVVMALRPDLVNLSKASGMTPLAGLARHLPHTPIGGGPFYTYPTFQDFTQDGAWGDVTHASAEKGKVILERAVPYLADLARTLLADPLPGAASAGDCS